MNNYDDIINLKRPASFRKKASIATRAAQFAPFSALTGYSEALEEIRRITTNRKHLTDSYKEVINEKLYIIKENLKKYPEVIITYFVKDAKKIGGEYIQMTGKIRRIDEANKKIILLDGKHIYIDDIIDISGAIFNFFEM